MVGCGLFNAYATCAFNRRINNEKQEENQRETNEKSAENHWKILILFLYGCLCFLKVVPR